MNEWMNGRRAQLFAATWTNFCNGFGRCCVWILCWFISLIIMILVRRAPTEVSIAEQKSERNNFFVILIPVLHSILLLISHIRSLSRLAINSTYSYSQLLSAEVARVDSHKSCEKNMRKCSSSCRYDWNALLLLVREISCRGRGGELSHSFLFSIAAAEWPNINLLGVFISHFFFLSRREADCCTRNRMHFKLNSIKKFTNREVFISDHSIRVFEFSSLETFRCSKIRFLPLQRNRKSVETRRRRRREASETKQCALTTMTFAFLHSLIFWLTAACQS